MRVFFVRLPWAMGRLVVAHQHEGPLAVQAIQPVQAHVGDDVSHIAGHDALLTAVRAVKDEGRVVIEALAGQDGPVIEAGRAVLRPAAQVPLAEDAGLPALSLQRLDEGRQAVVHGRGQCGDPVDVVPCAGEDGGAAGRANRVGTEAVVEAHATLRDAVEVGRPVDAAAIATHGVRRVVVGHDEEEVGLADHTCSRLLRPGDQFSTKRGPVPSAPHPAAIDREDFAGHII